MNTTRVGLLLAGWQVNLVLTKRLLAAVEYREITAQPAGVVNHPAWTLAHLIHYHPAILSLARGEPVADPAKHADAPRYDAGSTPVNDPSRYPTKAELSSHYRKNHERIVDALRNAPDDRLDQPPGLPRWAEGFESTAHVLQYLMVFHEAEHLGQLVAWRRAMGLDSLDD